MRIYLFYVCSTMIITTHCSNPKLDRLNCPSHATVDYFGETPRKPPNIPAEVSPQFEQPSSRSSSLAAHISALNTKNDHNPPEKGPYEAIAYVCAIGTRDYVLPATRTAGSTLYNFGKNFFKRITSGDTSTQKNSDENLMDEEWNLLQPTKDPTVIEVFPEDAHADTP